MVLSEMIGDYSQTITVNNSGYNEVEVMRGNEILYKGYAGFIIDRPNVLKFTDPEGKQHEYIKYTTYSRI